MTLGTLWLPPAAAIQTCSTDLPAIWTFPKLGGSDHAARIASKVFDQFFVYEEIVMNANGPVHLSCTR
jgi:hypothetical protein